ncbi:DUF3418 domain-containing protein [Vibrio chagasii]|nr:DUF3418 domain-containing protein [Vibrio chagasii]
MSGNQTRVLQTEPQTSVKEVEELKSKSRRRDILIDDDELFEFYDQRVGEDGSSGRHFDTWWKKTSKETPELLTSRNRCCSAVMQATLPI